MSIVATESTIEAIASKRAERWGLERAAMSVEPWIDEHEEPTEEETERSKAISLKRTADAQERIAQALQSLTFWEGSLCIFDTSRR